jgi:hypothetical protein
MNKKNNWLLAVSGLTIGVMNQATRAFAAPQQDLYGVPNMQIAYGVQAQNDVWDYLRVLGLPILGLIALILAIVFGLKAWKKRQNKNKKK